MIRTSSRPGPVPGVLDFTSSVITLDPSSPPLSVTRARIVWIPTDRSLVAKVPPDPSVPSRLDVQAIDPVRSPSSMSTAVPENSMRSPSVNADPVSGAVIVTAGRRFPGRAAGANSYARPSFSLGFSWLSTMRSTIQRRICPGSSLPGA